MNRIMILAIASLALTVSGCASNDPNTTDTMTTGAGVTPALDNATTDYSCTAAPGGVVGAGTTGAKVAGCSFSLPVDSIFLSADIQSGCDLTYDDSGDGLSDGSPTAGAKYASGTLMMMACDATAATATGTLTFQDA